MWCGVILSCALVMSAVGSASEVRSASILPLLRPDLARLHREIVGLHSELDRLPLLSSGHAGARRGFHGTYTPFPNKPYWLIVDLGKSFPVDAVVLVPAHNVEGSSAIDGYGFPRRFRIDLSNDPKFQRYDVVADENGREFPNPGPYPYLARVRGIQARYVRVMAVQRWMQTERMWVVAYAELAVLSGGHDVALGARVIPQGRPSIIQHPPYGWHQTWWTGRRIWACLYRTNRVTRMDTSRRAHAPRIPGNGFRSILGSRADR